MTCIVGLAHEGRVFIGGDSAGASHYDMMVRADRKVFRNGPFIMGFTTSFRMGQLLAVNLVAPEYHSDVDIFRYMVGSFVETARTCLKAGGFAKVESGVDSGGQFLVGFKGRLFQIEADFQVGENTCGLAALGCGGNYALGSLAETEGMAPKARVARALAVAERFSCGIKGPFFIEESQ